MQSQVLWFIRERGEVKGPFPAAIISQRLLIGRLQPTDEVSLDQKQWRRISGVSELTPDVMKADMGDPHNKERLEAARRWADERLAIDRRHPRDPNQKIQERRSDERRSEEPGDVVDHREFKTQRVLGAQSSESLLIKQWLPIALIVIVVVSLFVYALNFSQSTQEQGMDCDAPPSPAVNWSNCRFQGALLNGANLEGGNLRNADFSGSSLAKANLIKADLAFSNLSLSNLQQAQLQGAILKGASLHGANLRGADLTGADLSYVDLWGAKLQGANLEGVRLDRAVWIDRTVCGNGSVGQCIPVLVE